MADMTRNSLVTDYKATLMDAADKFDAAANADFIRHLDHAALDFGRIRMRVLKSSVTLQADNTEYTAPAGIKRVTRTQWGRGHNRRTKYWDANYIDALPSLGVIEGASGPALELSREVTAHELAEVGAECVYFYEAAHNIGDDAANTSIQPADRALLILRAQAEAMTELAMRNMGKPVTLRDGISNTPKTATPAAMAEYLMKQFETRGRRH